VADAVNRPPDPPVPPDATAAAVAGLAREFEGLRRTVDPLRALDDRVDHLARLVNQLADTLTALSARPARAPAPTWLLLPADALAARRVRDDLVAWLAAIYLRYPDAAASLPECWCWHPDLVEELLWLMHAWLAAYHSPTASIAAAGDWHDRQRPGVVRRIRQSAGSCSLENHTTRPGWAHHSSAAPEVPGLHALNAITSWWATRRDQPAPEPQPSPTSLRAALDPGTATRTDGTPR
jgi:hypothetical protein